VEPDGDDGVQEPMQRLNWTTIGLIAGLLFLVLVIAYFATRGNSDQDKLTNLSVSENSPASDEKLCASKATYDLIKRELFRRAAQLRGSDQAAYDQVASSAVVRMENPVMESKDSSNGAIHCSASLSLDLPPGVAVVGGRRTLTSDDVSLASRDFDVKGRSTLQLTTGALDARGNVTLSPELTAQAGTDLRRYAQQDGRVIVPAIVAGTIGQPQVTVDVQAAAARALQNELQRRATTFFDELLKRKKKDQ